MERIQLRSATKSAKIRQKLEEETGCPLILPHAETGFSKLSFLVRRRDVSRHSLSCIWSIENHILIVKWVPTDVPRQFQITNRYNLWNGAETHRYLSLPMDKTDICNARDSGFVTLGARTMNTIRDYCA